MHARVRVVIVHTLEHATAALDAAALTQVPVALQTAPDAVHYAGALYLKQMIEQARARVPHAACDAILDCGHDAGAALSAMRTGWRTIYSSAPAKTYEKLKAIADQDGLHLTNTLQEALDLRHARDPKQACMAWLKAVKA